MNNNRGKSLVNFTQSKHTSSESKQPLQMHNFMPMSSNTVQVDHDQIEAERHASFMNQLEQNLQRFWRERLSEISETSTDVPITSILPLARIRKVIKSDEKVEFMRSDIPMLFAKACEFLVMELTLRASMHTRQNKRRKLNRNDIVDAIRDEQHLAFLSQVVPTGSQHQEPDLPIVNNHNEVYVPQPICEVPMTPPNESEERPVAADDHHLAFPMNLHDNFYHGFFMGSGGMQENIPSFPHSSPSGDGANPYLKDFFSVKEDCK